MPVSSAPFLNYGRHLLDEADVQAVAEVMRGDLLTQGPVVSKFENAIAERVGAKYAVAVCNGTAGLHIAALAAGMGPGQRGGTAAVSFVASANCLLYTGAEADLIDIDPERLCMAPAALRRYIQEFPETRVVIPVAFAGLAADSAELRRLSGDRIIIEDACHAFGGRYANGQQVGSCAHSDMTVFSFHPVKPITTGEGGAITTNDPDLVRVLRLLRNHGIERDLEHFVEPGQSLEAETVGPWYYEQQMLGFNYRMTDLQAALGLSQLAKLDGFIERRRQIAALYDSAFVGLTGLRPLQADPADRARSALHLYVVQVDLPLLGVGRTEFMARLAARKVGSQLHYIPIYRQPFHKNRLGDVHSAYPGAESYYSGALSLPISQAMTDADAARVVVVVRDVVEECLASCR